MISFPLHCTLSFSPRSICAVSMCNCRSFLLCSGALFSLFSFVSLLFSSVPLPFLAISARPPYVCVCCVFFFCFSVRLISVLDHSKLNFMFHTFFTLQLSVDMCYDNELCDCLRTSVGEHLHACALYTLVTTVFSVHMCVRVYLCVCAIQGSTQSLFFFFFFLWSRAVKRFSTLCAKKKKNSFSWGRASSLTKVLIIDVFSLVSCFLPFLFDPAMTVSEKHCLWSFLTCVPYFYFLYLFLLFSTLSFAFFFFVVAVVFVHEFSCEGALLERLLVFLCSDCLGVSLCVGACVCVVASRSAWCSCLTLWLVLFFPYVFMHDVAPLDFFFSFPFTFVRKHSRVSSFWLSSLFSFGVLVPFSPLFS